MIKHVYDLTSADLERHPAWVFPMDETVEDETCVRPVAAGEHLPDGLQTIVRCTFQDGSGRTLCGYVYAAEDGRVDSVKPVAWVDDLCVTFWNGMVKPDEGYLAAIGGAGLDWPLTYSVDVPVSEPLTGVLDGIYYLEDDDVRCLKFLNDYGTI